MARDSFFGVNLAGQDPWARRGENDAYVKSLESRIRLLEAHRSGEIVTVVSYQAAAGTGFYNGGGWAVYPGAHTILFTKKYIASVSKVVVFGTVGAFKGTNTGNVTIALDFGPGPHQIGSFYFNDLTTHRLISCQDDTFTGINAGNLGALVLWDTPALTANADGNDAIRLTLLEVMI